MAAALGGQSKFWCFTINNYNGFSDLDTVKNWAYLVAGKEVGENGTPHLQCFVAYKVRTKFSTVKIQLPTAHIERMFTTPPLASEYCKKDMDFMEFGTLPDFNGATSGYKGGEAKAANYRKVIEVVINGDLDDVIEIDPVCYIQHYQGLKRIKQDHPTKPKALDDVCGEWLHGDPGVGKSHKAREEHDINEIYDKCANKWWDGYQGEEIVLIDDFDLVHHVLGHHLKRWADKYPFPAEQKGTTISIRPKKIIITSNYTIEQIFSDPALVLALKRRFKVRRILDWKLGMPIIVPAIPFADHSAHSEDDDDDNEDYARNEFNHFDD